MRAIVLADTHLRAGSRQWWPEAVEGALADAEVILHAGDLVEAAVLDRLALHAPVHAVLGNNDRGLEERLPLTLRLDLEGVTVGMVHDSGPAAGRSVRMRRLFPECSVVVFGHSHMPVAETSPDGQLLLNPGSPTQRRRAATPTYAELDLVAGRVAGARIVALPLAGHRRPRASTP